MRVGYSYLERQFADIEPYLDDIRVLVQSGDFTLGTAVEEFEKNFAALAGLPYAIGVGSGTDALALSLKAIGVGHGDEVITTPNTFIATIGAIGMVGATPVFVDNDEQYNIDVAQIEKAIGPKTRAILPVHLTGNPADMPNVMDIASRHGLPVIEDCAQAILASIDGVSVGSWGVTGSFSLHPLKNLNVWGDSGIIITKSEETATKLRLLRNHGLANRDEVQILGHNSRLDSLQAVVANRLFNEVQQITDRRIKVAGYYDDAFADLNQFITIPKRLPQVKQVYHTYVIRVIDRDKLLSYLINKKIEAKIHYPIPLHLQGAMADLGYKRGDFPVCERHCEEIITLPAHQHLEDDEIEYVAKSVREFYLR